MSINPKLHSNKKNQKEIQSVEYYYNGIVDGNRYILSEAISIVESDLQAHKLVAQSLLDRCYNIKTDSWRLGITGSPGVGKSSFINSFGSYLIKQNKKVAVIAIDPSSTISQGSILGDKTRMAELSQSEFSFIRPSPSQNCLGGVSSSTKEIICLCEAAGYDVVMVETVGVGQSETMVANMVDMFVLMLLPGAGDEIQGIKRGIVEMADLVLVNKSDGERLSMSKIIQQNYKNALHLLQLKEHQQEVKVLRCSSISRTGLEEIALQISQFFEKIMASKYLHNHRLSQDVKWFDERALISLERILLENKGFNDAFDTIRSNISSASTITMLR